VYVWLASVLLIIVLMAWQPIGGEVYRVTGGLRWVLLGVQLVGVWFIAKSVGAIDGLELAGIRQVSDERTNTLQVGGPYRVVRHPLYFGWVLIVFGALHMTGDRLAFAVITTAYLVLAMPWEERSLQRAFGEEYARYKQQVKWRIVPFLY
jgi:protein-S-isoprenylcysteine O-methyltransferase Ste14